jgi:hypothetical protein
VLGPFLLDEFDLVMDVRPALNPCGRPKNV